MNWKEKLRFPPETMAIRVIIIDDHALMRTGLRMLLNEQSGIEVVGDVGDVEAALDVLKESTVDVVVLDPVASEQKISDQIKTLARQPGAKVLLLTGDTSPLLPANAVVAGAWGFVVKSASVEEVAAAIRSIHAGNLFLITPHREAFTRPVVRPAKQPTIDLSTREEEVLTLIARGNTNQQIADALYLSVKTIETYRSRLSKKLGLSSRSQMVTYAIEAGLLGLGARA